MLQEYLNVKPSKSFLLFLIIFLIIPALIMLSFMQESDASRKREISALKDEITNLRSERDNLQKKVHDLEMEASNLKKEVLSSRQDLDIKDSKIKELQDKNKEYAEILKDMEEKLKLYGAAGVTGNKKQKVAYLTFDDGPSSNTDKILEILDKYKIKATFFVVGKESMMKKYGRIIEEGHIIGNHTYSHDYDKIYSSADVFLEDFDKLNTLLMNFYGYTTDIFRFPGGSTNAASKKEGGAEIIQEIINETSKKGYRYFDWNVTAADATRDGGVVAKDAIVDNVLSGTKGRKNIIVLMHDAGGKETTVEALPEIIEGLAAQGYKFGVLSKYV